MASIMQWQNEDVTEIFSPDIDEIVCDYYDHFGVLWNRKKSKVLVLAMKVGDTCNSETSFELDSFLQILKVIAMVTLTLVNSRHQGQRHQPHRDQQQ